MLEVVQELVTLVGGSDTNSDASTTGMSGHTAAGKKPRFHHSDNTFHQIAGDANKKASRRKTAVAKAIPLDNESAGFDEF
jgi:hypothetical protein